MKKQGETLKGLPVKGYQPQPALAIHHVNISKMEEERLLRSIENLEAAAGLEVDKRWAAIAKTHFEQGFMALNRAVFKPTRIKLPEDEQ